MLSHIDYVPLWDGRIYADCILAAGERLSFRGLGCAGHNAQAYIVLLALAERVAPGSFVPIVVANVVLGLLVLGSLARLLDHLLPGRTWATERALVVAAFAVQPLFIASTLQPNVDFGTLVFTLPCLCALLERRVLAATLLGCLVVFTKETGVIVYGVLAMSALVFAVRRAGDGWRETFVRFKPFAPLAVPVLLGGVALADDILGLRLLAFDARWSSGHIEADVSDVIRAFVPDAVDLNNFAGIFILNFMWVPTLVIVVDLGLAALARLLRREDAESPGPSEPARVVIYGALLTTFILTRYKTFSNFRYFLALNPLFLAIVIVAVAKRVPWRLARHGLVCTLIILFTASIFRTIDPVSRAVFGTWPFGAHDLIDVTANTGECCGHGRDQLVYNLEFAAMSTLQDEALAKIRPTAATVFSMDPQANWYTVGRVDSATFHRTLRRFETIEPRVLDTNELGKLPVVPEEIFYFAFENVENQRSLTWLAGRYAIADTFDFDTDGYTLRVYRMTRRQS